MKSLFLPSLCFAALASWSGASEPDETTANRLSRDQIEILVSPIALYPDPLIALILPASTRASDIVLAARFLDNGGDPHATASQPWEASVKSLARYAEVITYLDANLAWTQSLGEAFLDQPDEVMTAIQTLRTRARTNGLLTATDEQDVIIEEEEIRIVPARSQVIYVPRYDPEILYVTRTRTYLAEPFIIFGLGYSIGAWLNHDCDWRHHTVRIVHRPAGWPQHPDWRIRHSQASGPNSKPWTPSPRHRRHFHRPSHPTQEVVLRPTRHWDTSRRSRLDSSGANVLDRHNGARWSRHDPARPRSPAPDTSPRHDAGSAIEKRKRPTQGATDSPSRPARPEFRRPTTGTTPPVYTQSSPSPMAGHERRRHGGQDTPRWQNRDQASRPGPETGSSGRFNSANPRESARGAPSRSAPEPTVRAARSENTDGTSRPHKAGDRGSRHDLQ
jgi:hypothetical protein